MILACLSKFYVILNVILYIFVYLIFLFNYNIYDFLLEIIDERPIRNIRPKRDEAGRSGMKPAEAAGRRTVILISNLSAK